MSIHDLIDKELAKERKAFEKEIRDLYAACERAETASIALREKAQAIVERMNGGDFKPAVTPKERKPRTPVEATDVQRRAVAELIANTDGVLSLKEIARALDLGTRTVAAALRNIGAIEKPRGKWSRALPALPADDDAGAEE